MLDRSCEYLTRILYLPGQRAIPVLQPFGEAARNRMALSLLERLRSRESNSFTDRLLSAMRNEFGGHAIKKS